MHELDTLHIKFEPWRRQVAVITKAWEDQCWSKYSCASLNALNLLKDATFGPLLVRKCWLLRVFKNTSRPFLGVLEDKVPCLSRSRASSGEAGGRSET